MKETGKLGLVRYYEGQEVGVPADGGPPVTLGDLRGCERPLASEGISRVGKRRAVGGARKITFISMSQQGPLDE